MTTAPAGPVASDVMLAGRLSVGAVVSQLTTVADTLTELVRVRVPVVLRAPLAVYGTDPETGPVLAGAVSVTVEVTNPELNVLLASEVQLLGRAIVPLPLAVRTPDGLDVGVPGATVTTALFA